MLTNSRTNSLLPWPAGMPDGWYSSTDAAAAQAIINAWALIPTVLITPYMGHSPSTGLFRPSLFLGAMSVIGAVPDSVYLGGYGGIYVHPSVSSSAKKQIFANLSLGALIVHEWGHLMDFNPTLLGITGVTKVGDKPDLNGLWTAVNAGLPTGTYAKTNRQEWMAELFDGYIRDRKKMAMAINARASTSDPFWLADPNVTAVIAMFQTYYPFPGSSNFRPTYTLGDTPNGTNTLAFIGGESLSFVSGLETSSAITAYKWVSQTISGGIASAWTTIGTGATLTTTLPTGLAVGTIVAYAVSGQNALGFGAAMQICQFQAVATLSGSTAHDGLYQGLPSHAPKQTLLTAGFYGACEWQYRETVQSDPNAGWLSSGVTTATYTPTAASLSVRIRVPSSGSYSGICTLV